MENHVFIGLGGTGGSILEQLRIRVYEQFKTNQPQDVNKDIDFRLGYLYLDSNKTDIDNAQTWSTIGHHVGLQPAQCACVNSDPKGILSNLSDYRGVQAFVSPDDEQAMMHVQDEVGNNGIAGQRRRFGRILLASSMNAGGTANFMSLLKQEVSTVKGKNSGNEKVNFHICAGLAGGTGSGTIIDVIAQIKHLYKESATIFLYLYVPEDRDLVYNSGVTYYQANGYAALQELNAMSVRQYAPVDISGQETTADGKVSRLNVNDSGFTSAYLFSRTSEKGIDYDIKQQIPPQVANFIYQKIVQGMSQNMIATEKCENGSLIAEKEDGIEVRSTRFLSFGLKRIVYPEKEIKEYAADEFVKMATKQMYYGWPEGLDYPAEIDPEKVDLSNRVQNDDKNSDGFYSNRRANCVPDTILTLSKPLPSIITEGGPNYNSKATTWKSYREGWGFRERLQEFAEEVSLNGKIEPDCLRKFDLLCNDFYDKKFRQLGVVGFFASYKNTVSSFSEEICRVIEGNLLTEWREGKMSIIEVVKYLEALIDVLEKRKNGYASVISSYNGKLNSNKKRYQEIIEEFDHHGIIGKFILNKQKEDFNDYVKAKTEYFEAKVNIEGYSYATKLLEQVINDLRNNYLPNAEGFLASLHATLEVAIEDAKKKCNDEGIDIHSSYVKVYDPKKIKDRVRVYSHNEAEGKEFARQLRDLICEQTGNHKGFAEFAKLDLGNLFITSAQVAAEKKMDEDVTSDLVNVNILDLLAENYKDESRFSKFVKELYDDSSVLLAFNEGEIKKNGGAKMRKGCQIWLPEDGENEGFRANFIEKFKASNNGGYDFTEGDVTVNSKKNEIVIATIASGFPLRYARTISTCKKKYLELSRDPLNQIVMHTESICKSYPDLYMLDTEDVANLLKPTLLFVYSMGLLKEIEDFNTGAKQIVLPIEDAAGHIGDVVFSRDGILASIELLSDKGSDDGAKLHLSKAAVLHKIKDIVDEQLSQRYMHNNAKKDLRDKMKLFVENDLLKLCKGNDRSPIYLDYINVMRDIFNNELKEL